MLPTLHGDVSPVPRGAVDIGQGLLLRGQDSKAQLLRTCEAQAIQNLMRRMNIEQGVAWAEKPMVTKWARLGLANGQVVRCWWKEGVKELSQVRMLWNVKVSCIAFKYTGGQSVTYFDFSCSPKV